MLFNGTPDATSPTTGGSTTSSRPVRGHFAPIRIVPLAAALALACGNGVDPPEEQPPDLSGTYDVLSVTQGSFTFEPPNVAGTFVLKQDSVAGSQAMGSMTLELQVQTPEIELEDMGTYTNSLNGSWTQRGQQGSASGTYTFENDTLEVIVTEPPAAASRSVWLQR
ncbi:MAG: hypothetical protein OXG58_12045 [Gemmatimonadetes bacterium]|nr:hypothetical protein [Gemmatimonadota bacterium]MCY3943530.1 hypothetical protein [Gemmatimonadota bacterium]